MNRNTQMAKEFKMFNFKERMKGCVVRWGRAVLGWGGLKVNDIGRPCRIQSAPVFETHEAAQRNVRLFFRTTASWAEL